MPTISALVHTLNEENNIAYCLNCLRWCDEIVVVDMFSDDRTAEIVREYTDKVFTVPRMGMADPARRFGIERTSGDWILVIDADELVPLELSRSLREISDRSDVDVVFVPMMNYLLGKWIRHTAWWPQMHPRFFRRGAVIPNDYVHESYHINSPRILKLPAEERQSICHFNYTNSKQFIEKMNRYTDKEYEKFVNRDCRTFSLFRLIMVPLFEFTFRFIYKKGFLDGIRGFILSAYMAFYRFLAEAKLWEYYNNPDPLKKYQEMKKAICERHSNIKNIPIQR